MNKNEFINELSKRNIELSNEQLDNFDIYAKYLKQYNQKINLTAIDEYEEVFEKHFYDCLLLVDHKLEGSLVDVGSGAGFPGVVLKIVFPELRVILLEPIKKRCVFLESLIEKLNLKNIEVINERAEDYSLKNREKYDYVTARAVSNLNSLIEVSGAMVKVGGYFIALRGKDGLEELQNAKKAIETMGFEQNRVLEDKLLDDSRRIIGYLKKIKNTSIKYPRKYSIIKQHTL